MHLLIFHMLVVYTSAERLGHPARAIRADKWASRR
jgi:hypothetical protein